MKNLKRNQIGITLISLVVTIIVLLILAGISIAMITGENGILQKATEAKTKSDNAQITERIQLAYNSALTGGHGSYTKDTLMNALENEFGTDYDVDDSNDENWKMKAHGQEVIIPAGEKEEEKNFTLHLWDLHMEDEIFNGYMKFTNDGRFEFYAEYYSSIVDRGDYNFDKGTLTLIPDEGGIPLPFGSIWNLQSDGSFIDSLTKR